MEVPKDLSPLSEDFSDIIRLTIDYSPNPVLIYLENGTLFYYNKAAELALKEEFSSFGKINFSDFCFEPNINIFSDDFEKAENINVRLAENANINFCCTIIKTKSNSSARFHVYLEKLDCKDKEKSELLLISETIEKLSNVFPDIVLLTDIDTRIIFASDKGKNIWGFDSSELIGKIGFDFIYEDDLQLAEENFKAMFEREIGPRTYRFVTKKGEIKLFEVNVEILYNRQKNPFGIFFVVRDVSERYEFEKRLRVSEAHNKALLNNLPFMVWLKDISGKYISVNQPFADAFNKEAKDVVNRFDEDLPANSLFENNQKEHLQIIQESKTLDYEVEIGNADHKKWFEIFKAPVFSDNSDIIGSFGYARDFTDKKLLEIELQENEALFRSLIQTSPDGICICELDGIISYSTEKAFEMFKANGAEDIIGRNIVDLVMPSFKAEIIEKMRLVSEGEKVQYSEFMAQKIDGEYFWIEGIAELFRDTIDKRDKIFFTIRDITERKNYLEEQDRLLEQVSLSKIELESALFEKNSLIEEIAASERQAKQANAEKDKFFSIIAHDLKNPFSGFLGLTQILSESLLDLPMREMQSYTQQLQESARNLYSLLENLLEWSRAQRGKISMELEFAPLKYLTQNNIDIISSKAAQKKIEIENNCDNLYVYADVNMLNGILRNLISNAVKFSHRGSKIQVNGILVGEEYIQISVKDAGIGIEPENIDKLFRIDERISKEGTDGEPSTGLGLLLCKEFIEKHGGEIWVESELGVGSEFFFTIPYKNPEMELEQNYDRN